ncbi:MAG: DUF5116 domain-containing protein, partial [Muribaculaceae bacterium]|nr:DUF5116 domain-containing protein [Muribaculaceae bacterium]
SPGSYYVKADFNKGTVTLTGTTAIDSVGEDEDMTDAVYFTLQGVRVEHPGAGVYIRVIGSEAMKVVIR